MHYPVINVTQCEGQLSSFHLNGNSMTTPQSEETKEEKNCLLRIKNYFLDTVHRISYGLWNLMWLTGSTMHCWSSCDLVHFVKLNLAPQSVYSIMMIWSGFKLKLIQCGSYKNIYIIINLQ